MKKCPYCGEEIQDEAIKCKHCKEWLSKPQDNTLVQEGTTHHKLTPEELAKEREELGTPDMRPLDFDKTYEAWLMRISLWGNTTIVHVDPDFKEKREVTTDQFLDAISDPNLMKIGNWNIDYPDFNKVILHRTYQGFGGRMIREEYIVTNDLSKLKERKARMKN